MMNASHLLRCLAAAAVALLASACTITGDFTVLSNKLVRTGDFDLSKAPRTKNVAGEDVTHIVLFFPVSSQANLEEAIDDALRKGDGDVLTDAVVHYSWFYIPLIYGQAKWTVTGDVVRTRAMPRD